MWGGSSPHSQGTAFLDYVRAVLYRIIPALAGNRVFTSIFRSAPGDHPRTRREQAADGQIAVRGRGSSPHSQGTVIELYRDTVFIRIIPALAGNSPSHPHKQHPPRDHPRTRREQRSLEPIYPPTAGSSPHSQGTAMCGVRLPGAVRIIPALAGNRNAASINSRSRWDHPRTRREQLKLTKRRSET